MELEAKPPNKKNDGKIGVVRSAISLENEPLLDKKSGPLRDGPQENNAGDIAGRRTGDFFRIRDLPVMRYQGERNWPPLWVGQNGAPRLVGEIGTLKDAFVDVRRETRCFLFMAYGGYGYIATLEFDDKLFCPILVAALKKHIGKPIQEIGSLTLADD